MKFSEYQAQLEAGSDGAPTVTPVPREAREIQGMRAGFIARALAAAIDIGAVAVVLLIINGVITFLQFVLSNTVSVTLPEIAASFASGVFLLWFFWTLGWWMTGRTLGMHIMGLRVVNHVGDNPRLAAAALRAVFCIAFPVGLLWVLVSHENRSVQDLVLRTSVINDWVMGLPKLRHRPNQ